MGVIVVYSMTLDLVLTLDKKRVGPGIQTTSPSSSGTTNTQSETIVPG